MSNVLLNELSRRLPERGDVKYEMTNNSLKDKLGDENGFEVRPSGGISCPPDSIYDDLFHEMEILIADQVREIQEYVEAMNKAPDLEAGGLEEGYKRIAEFKDTVLAGKYLGPENGFKFVTWEYDKAGIYAGHYYDNDFPAAKEDFAKRSMLIDRNKVFSDKELAEIYRCVEDTFSAEYELTDEQENMLLNIQDKIRNSVPNLTELIFDEDTQELDQTLL